jgi:predicted metal-dependent phosphoesterase TrpH
MGLAEYLDAIQALGLDVACLTNHGDLDDYLEMKRLSPPGLSLVPGVEISSPEGDFLLFSPDTDFLSGLEPSQQLPPRRYRPHGTAVVWAHPFAGIRGGLDAGHHHVRRVAAQVDGIEVFNGNWPDDAASVSAVEAAERYGLAQLGGSDSHRREQLLRCWTGVDGSVRDGAGLAKAVLEHRTVPRRR